MLFELVDELRQFTNAAAASTNATPTFQRTYRRAAPIGKPTRRRATAQVPYRGSSTLTTVSARMFVSFCRAPRGHRISTVFAS